MGGGAFLKCTQLIIEVYTVHFDALVRDSNLHRTLSNSGIKKRNEREKQLTKKRVTAVTLLSLSSNKKEFLNVRKRT